MFDNLKIGVKIALGFAIVVVLLAILGSVSWYEANQTKIRLAAFSNQANIADAMQDADAAVLKARMGTVRFVYAGGDANLQTITSELAFAQAELAKARTALSQEDARRQNDEITAALRNYQSGIQEIATARNQREELTKNILYTTGNKLRAVLVEMRDAEAQAGNLQNLVTIGRLTDDIWTTRILLFRIMAGDKEYDFTNVQKRLASATGIMTELAAMPLAAGQAERVATAKALMAEFTNGMGKLENSIKAVETLQRTQLVATATVVAEKLQSGRAAAGRIQDDQNAAAEASANVAETVAKTLTPVAVLLAAVLAWGIGRSVSRPVIAMTGAMDQLAQGDISAQVPAVGRRDEIGRMAAAVQVFKDNLIRNRAMEEEVKRTQARAEEDRRAALRRMADAFEASVKGVVAQVSAAARQMQANSQHLTDMAEDGRVRASSVAAAAEEASANVQTVAASAEEMTSSIGEISRQVGQSNDVARRAASRADETTRNVQALADQAKGIGDVVGLINSIASQTNLLALNATIEAARAGEAGKGFAVVASEVKSLANQTAKATEEIAAQITGMQDATRGAVNAINEIGGVIAQINEISTAIAAAVEQQDAATREIARNVQQAAVGTEEISRNIGGVQQIAEGTGSAAQQALDAARSLFNDSERLSHEVDRFISQVRAG